MDSETLIRVSDIFLSAAPLIQSLIHGMDSILLKDEKKV